MKNVIIPDASNMICLSEAKARTRPNPVFDSTHPKVKDDKDHFPLGDADQARNALARANQYDAAPSWWGGTLQELKNAVARKVKSEYPSIEVSKKSTSSTDAAVKVSGSEDPGGAADPDDGSILISRQDREKILDLLIDLRDRELEIVRNTVPNLHSQGLTHEEVVAKGHYDKANEIIEATNILAFWN